MNGYVDAVAFSWGSPSKASNARLRQSGLLGHCLITADEMGLHHLYQALSRIGDLSPADWYALCSAVVSDPEGGFVSREMDRLGQRIADDPELWKSYVAEVQSRLQAKNYDLFAQGVTSLTVVWLFLEQLRLEFVPVLHRLQGRLAAQS